MTLIAPSTPPTDQDWQRLTATIAILADAAPDQGDRLTWLLDFIEALANRSTE